MSFLLIVPPTAAYDYASPPLKKKKNHLSPFKKVRDNRAS